MSASRRIIEDVEMHDLPTGRDLGPYLNDVLRPYAKKLRRIQDEAHVGPLDVDKLGARVRSNPSELTRLLEELASQATPSRRLVKTIKDLAAFKKSGDTYVLRSAEANGHGSYGSVSDKLERLRGTISD